MSLQNLENLVVRVLHYKIKNQDTTLTRYILRDAEKTCCSSSLTPPRLKALFCTWDEKQSNMPPKHGGCCFLPSSGVSGVPNSQPERDLKQCVFLLIKITRNDFAIIDTPASVRRCAGAQRRLGAANQAQLQSLLIQVPFPRGSRLWPQKPPRACKLSLTLFGPESRSPLNSPAKKLCGTRI